VWPSRHSDRYGSAGYDGADVRRGALLPLRRHLRRTARIALVVGLVLTAINQLDVMLRGDATRDDLGQVRAELRRAVHRLQGLLSGRAA
jgi:hypothetical protein